ncbi:MAG TPA: Ig-like domain-containing protein, partial [Gemmataceae bacterium]|nr:Ig-like domain-containing protein [Gemmataceae bacterium]
TDTFTYRATEVAFGGGTGLSGNTVTVTVTVDPVPDAPVAQPDSYSTDQDVTLSVNLYNGVLANDTDADSDALTAAVVTAPEHGTLTLNADGSFTFAPDEGYFGTDWFTYTASDGGLTSAAATVTLTVVRTNNPPVAWDDSATTDEDKQVGIAVITNDSDQDGDAIRAVVFTQPANGTAAYSANDGKIYYMPKKDWFGTDTFTYRAYDGRAYSTPATVTVTVTSVPDAPVPGNDTFFATEDTPLTVTLVEPNRPLGVLWNDTDAENDPLTATEVIYVSSGATVALNPDGSFTYTPKPNFSGSDYFYYRVSDGTLSSVGQATINVRPVNDPPVGNPDSLNATEDTTLSILVTALTGNDTDADGDTLSIGNFTQPAHGTLTRAVTFNGLIYVPHANYNGPDSFTYQPLDRAQVQGNVTTVTINVAAVNDPPVAQSNSYTLTEDTPLTVAAPGVLVNDTDTENDPLGAVLVTGPANGTLTLNADGSFTYTPRANYFGTDSFTYRASDGQAQGANQATVVLTITAVNDAPAAAADSYAVTEDGTLTVAPGGSALDQQSLGATPSGQTFNAGAGSTHWQQGVKAGFAGTLKSIDLYVYSGRGSFDLVVNKGAPWQSDSPDYVTRVTVPTGSANTWITVDVSAGNVALAAGEDFTIGLRNGSGADLFLLGAQDAGSNYPAGRIWYNGTAYPAGTTSTYDLLFRTRMRIQGGVLANDTDADGNALSAVLVSGPAHGTLTLNADGGFTYTPHANYAGPDSFTYKATDGALESNVATASITVAGVNDAPTLDAPANLTVAEDAGQQTVTLTGIAAGPPDEFGTLTVTAASDNTALIPNPSVVYN